MPTARSSVIVDRESFQGELEFPEDTGWVTMDIASGASDATISLGPVTTAYGIWIKPAIEITIKLTPSGGSASSALPLRVGWMFQLAADSDTGYTALTYSEPNTVASASGLRYRIVGT